MDRKTSITEALPQIETRIKEIKSKGKSADDVDIQRKLYFEGTELESMQKEIEGKKKTINDKLDNLSPKQKAWFGIKNDEDSDVAFATLPPFATPFILSNMILYFIFHIQIYPSSIKQKTPLLRGLM